MKIQKPKRELLCQRCGHDYPIWYCDHFLWNPVAEYIEKQTNVQISFLCMNCFALYCEKAVITGENPDCKIIWKLEIGTHNDAALSLQQLDKIKA
jgi:hypothetical protein